MIGFEIHTNSDRLLTPYDNRVITQGDLVYRQYCLLLAPKHLLKNYFFPTYSIETLFTCIKLIISSQLVLYNLLIRRVDTTFQNSSNSLVSNSSCKLLLRTYSIETLFTSVENLPSSTKSCCRVSYSNEAGIRRNKTLATFFLFPKIDFLEIVVVTSSYL